MLKDNFEIVIGIEIHLELLTKTKMFTNAKVGYESKPNTNLNEYVVGYPGAKPTVNKLAVEKAILAAKALGFKKENVNQKLYFDRKHYFYPDLPKGYQITQFFKPIAKNGQFSFYLNNKLTTVNINEMHLEEDTAKQIHLENKTLLDYNRSGNPLIEIVTDHTSIDSIEKAQEYIKNLRDTLVFLNITDGKMNEGSLRCDVNLSIRPRGSKQFGTRVEIKNINSISNIKKAIESEIDWQIKQYLRKQDFVQMTKRFDDKLNKTIILREKRGNDEYRYYVEDNILPITITNLINSIYGKKIILPKDILNSIKEDLNPSIIEKINSNLVYLLIIANLPNLIHNNWFLKKKGSVLINNENSKQFHHFFILTINLILNDFAAYLKMREDWFFTNLKLLNDLEPNKEKEVSELTYLLDQLIILSFYFYSQEISSKHLKKIIVLFIESLDKQISFQNDLITKIIKDNNLKLIKDEKEITLLIIEIINKLFNNDSKLFSSYKENPKNLEGKLMVQLMLITQGNVDPILSNKLMKPLIESFIKENLK